MKRIIVLVFLLNLFNAEAQVKEANPSQWPEKTNTKSVYATTLLGAFTPVNLSYEYLVHNSRIHIGYTTGLTATLCEGAAYGTLGVHLALTLMTGMRNGHFETKLGGVYNPIKLWSDGYDEFAFKFVPVVSFSHRWQRPDELTYYRIGISTGGIGFGIGFIL
jgi:hypothetical protein